MRITEFKKQYKGYKVETADMYTDKRILVLKGDNGSGKSTVLKAISNMISYQGEIDSKGTISFMSENIKFPSDMTVVEVINSINCLDQASNESITKLVDHFCINDKLNEKVTSLSTGMKMKLQLICTFLVEKDIYILDEPFSGLDQASVLNLVGYILKSTKKFIIATHLDVEFKEECDVIMIC